MSPRRRRIAAADREILVERRGRAGGRVGIRQHRGQHLGQGRLAGLRVHRLLFRLLRGGRRAIIRQLDQNVRRGRRARLRTGRKRRAGLPRARRQDQGTRILQRVGEGDEHRRAAPAHGAGRPDRDGERAARQSGPQRHEMPARQVAERLGLPALQAEEVGGAGHVDVEEGPAHQEVRGLGGDVLGELRQPLGGDDAGQSALASAAHEVGHGAEREAPRLVRDLAGGGRREELRLVHRDQHRVPMVAVGVEQAAQERRGGAHLPVGVEVLQGQHHRDPVGAHPGGDPLQRDVVAVGLHDHVAVAVGEAGEIALRVDDRLLHEARRSAPAGAAAGATCRSRNCPGPGAAWRAVR